MLRAVKPRAPSEKYPPKVQARLAEFSYRYKPFRSRKHPRSEEPEKPPQGLRPLEAGCIGAVILALLLGAYYVYLLLRGKL
jgi:hypothetical protein